MSRINRELHHRLSEIFPRKHEGCSEHLGCKNSIEKEHDEEPVIMRDERSRVEACSHPKVHVFSDACVLGHSDSVSASETGEQNAEDVMKSDGCKNRRNTASDPIDIEWHVCLVKLRCKY